MCCASFSVKKTVSAVSFELVDQNNISADCYQLILLVRVCLALAFKQDQEPVRKELWGALNIDSDCQSDC